MTTAVFVVVLRLGNGIIHVNSRYFKLTGLKHFHETVNASCCFLCNAVNLIQHLWILVVNHAGQIAAVVEDHIAVPRRAVFKNSLLYTPFTFFVSLAFPCVHGNPCCGDARGGVVLSRKDVARRPAHFSAQLNQRLDKNGSLHGHMNAADDLRAGKWLLCRIFFAQSHKRRHFRLGKCDLATTKIG